MLRITGSSALSSSVRGFSMLVSDRDRLFPLLLPGGVAPATVLPPRALRRCSLAVVQGNLGASIGPRVTIPPTFQRLLQVFPEAATGCAAWQTPAGAWCCLQFPKPYVLFELHERTQEWNSWVKTSGPTPGTTGADIGARVPLKRGKAPKRVRPGKLVLSTSRNPLGKSAPRALFDPLDQLWTTRQRRRRAWLDERGKVLILSASIVIDDAALYSLLACLVCWLV
jgi:hypothetical protein